MASACIEKSHAFKNPSGFFLFWTAILLRSVQYWDKTFNLGLNKLEYFENQSIFGENEKQTVLFSAWCQTAIQFVRYNLDITVYSIGLNQFQQSYRTKMILLSILQNVSSGRQFSHGLVARNKSKGKYQRYDWVKPCETHLTLFSLINIVVAVAIFSYWALSLRQDEMNLWHFSQKALRMFMFSGKL